MESWERAKGIRFIVSYNVLCLSPLLVQECNALMESWERAKGIRFIVSYNVLCLSPLLVQECNALMESWERAKGIRFLWGQVKPFIRGKILFTPDTPASRYSLNNPMEALNTPSSRSAQIVKRILEIFVIIKLFCKVCVILLIPFRKIIEVVNASFSPFTDIMVRFCIQ